MRQFQIATFIGYRSKPSLNNTLDLGLHGKDVKFFHVWNPFYGSGKVEAGLTACFDYSDIWHAKQSCMRCTAKNKQL